MVSRLIEGVCVGAGVAGAVGLAAGGCAYAALWPASQIFGATLIAPKRPDELALTFDDGPNPVWTPRLLDVLGQHAVKAVFFLVGSYAEAEPVLVRRIVDEGHLIGNHSWSHPNLAITGGARVREELRRTSEILGQITGRPVRYLRPPFGARRPFVLRVARELGMTPVMWNAMTDDWKEPSEERIAGRLIERIDCATARGFAGNIVLHDGGHLEPAAHRGPSVAAAGRLIEHYKETHRFVKLDVWVQ
jgi:peptidoglycan/xylan/chitin deacetylase (PgdA/CDA1 family)